MRVWLCFLALAAGEAAHAQAVRFTDATAAAGITFRHVNGSGGSNPQKYFIETMGAGCAFLDYDSDGDLDIFAANGYDLARKDAPRATDVLYDNQGNGRFVDVSRAAGIEQSSVGYGMGTCAGDYDNDGYVDLYVANYGPNVLYHNNGDGTFTDVTARSGTGDPRWGTGCAFADYDNDGDLDLFVANYVAFSLEHPGDNLKPYLTSGGAEFKGGSTRDLKMYPHPDNYEGVPDVLYRNDGSGAFTDVTRQAGVYDPGGKGLGVVWADFDNDGDVDLFVANDQTPNNLFQNRGDGTFADIGLVAGVAYNEDGRTRAGMGVDAGDYDRDGAFDLLVTNFQGEPNTVARNDGNGYFTDLSFPVGTGTASQRYVKWGTGFVDVDHDGLLDVFTVGGHVLDNVSLVDQMSTYSQPCLLFRNTGPGRDGRYGFADITAGAGPVLSVKRVGRGTAFGDCDNDGDVDILVSCSNSPMVLLRNDTPRTNHWLTVSLAGAVAAGPPGTAAGGKPSNRSALNARVKVTSGGATQVAQVKSGASYLSQSDLRLNFGLGAQARVERLEVRWPRGRVDTFTDLAGDRFLTVREGEGIVGGR